MWFDLRSVVQLEYTFVGAMYGVESSHPATVVRAAANWRSLGGSAFFIFCTFEKQNCEQDSRLEPNFDSGSTSKKGKASRWPDTHLSLTHAANDAATVRARVCRGAGKSAVFRGLVPSGRSAWFCRRSRSKIIKRLAVYGGTRPACESCSSVGFLSAGCFFF